MLFCLSLQFSWQDSHLGSCWGSLFKWCSRNTFCGLYRKTQTNNCAHKTAFSLFYFYRLENVCTSLEKYSCSFINLYLHLVVWMFWGFCLFVLAGWGVPSSPNFCICPSQSRTWARQGGLARISTSRTDSGLVYESLLFKRGGVFLRGHYPLVWMLMELLAVISQMFLTTEEKNSCSQVNSKSLFSVLYKKRSALLPNWSSRF